MKKVLFILLLVVIISIAGIGGYLYMNADALLARLRPELERIASQTMKTPVKLGELKLGLGLKPTVSVDGVSVGETGESRAISVKNVLLALDLMPLLSKELKVTELRIERPRITAVKANGAVKIVGLPEKNQDEASTISQQRSPAPPQQATAEKLPIAFALEKFLLTDGEIVYEDTTPGAPLPRLEIKDLKVSSELTIADNKLQLGDADISATVNQALPVELSVGVISYDLASTDATLEKIIVTLPGGNASLNGALNLNQMKGKFFLNSSGFDLTKLTALHAIVPALKQFPLTGSVAPEITIDLASKSSWDLIGNTELKELGTTVNNFTLNNLTGAISLHGVPAEQSAAAEGLSFNFQGAPMTLDFKAGLKGGEANLEKMVLSAFSGTIDAKADLSITAPQTFKTTATVASINIDQALAALSGQKESPLSGTIENVGLNLSGELGDRLKDTTGGRITVKIKDALLKQVNLAHEAFKGILTLPIIGERITAGVPEEFRAELAGADTKIRYISGALNGTNGTFTTNDFVLLGSFFSIRGTGSVSLSGAVDLATTISFNDRFSALLVERVKELRSALDRNGELSFPLSISGIAPKLRIVPDTKALVKLGAESAVREGAQRLLEGALKGKKGDGKDGIKGLGNLLGF